MSALGQKQTLRLWFQVTEAVPTEAFKEQQFYFVGSVDMAPSRKSRTHNNRQISVLAEEAGFKMPLNPRL
jgi:hypothetical protein